MLFEHFTGPETVPVTFHRTEVVRDRYGDTTETSVDTEARGYFAPSASVERGGELVTTPASVYLDGTELVPDANDEVTVMGTRWTIQGDPQVWAGAGVVVALERFGEYGAA